MSSLLFMKFGYLCLACRTLKWVQKYWSARGMSGHESAGPLRACVKIADCCDSSSTTALTCVKSLAMMFESVCATASERFAIVDHFFLFWWGRLGRVASSSNLIK
jgi:hypothetical protein